MDSNHDGVVDRDEYHRMKSFLMNGGRLEVYATALPPLTSCSLVNGPIASPDCSPNPGPNPGCTCVLEYNPECNPDGSPGRSPDGSCDCNLDRIMDLQDYGTYDGVSYSPKRPELAATREVSLTISLTPTPMISQFLANSF